MILDVFLGDYILVIIFYCSIISRLSWSLIVPTKITWNLKTLLEKGKTHSVERGVTLTLSSQSVTSNKLPSCRISLASTHNIHFISSVISAQDLCASECTRSGISGPCERNMPFATLEGPPAQSKDMSSSGSLSKLRDLTLTNVGEHLKAEMMADLPMCEDGDEDSSQFSMSPREHFDHESDLCLRYFESWTQSRQTEFVEQLIARMSFHQHEHIYSILMPMLQRDFITALPGVSVGKMLSSAVLSCTCMCRTQQGYTACMCHTQQCCTIRHMYVP